MEGSLAFLVPRPLPLFRGPGAASLGAHRVRPAPNWPSSTSVTRGPLPLVHALVRRPDSPRPRATLFLSHPSSHLFPLGAHQSRAFAATSHPLADRWGLESARLIAKVLPWRQESSAVSRPLPPSLLARCPRQVPGIGGRRKGPRRARREREGDTPPFIIYHRLPLRIVVTTAHTRVALDLYPIPFPSQVHLLTPNTACQVHSRIHKLKMELLSVSLKVPLFFFYCNMSRQSSKFFTLFSFNFRTHSKLISRLSRNFLHLVVEICLILTRSFLNNLTLK